MSISRLFSTFGTAKKWKKKKEFARPARRSKPFWIKNFQFSKIFILSHMGFFIPTYFPSITIDFYFSLNDNNNNNKKPPSCGHNSSHRSRNGIAKISDAWIWKRDKGANNRLWNSGNLLLGRLLFCGPVLSKTMPSRLLHCTRISLVGSADYRPGDPLPAGKIIFSNHVL